MNSPENSFDDINQGLIFQGTIAQLRTFLTLEMGSVTEMYRGGEATVISSTDSTDIKTHTNLLNAISSLSYNEYVSVHQDEFGGVVLTIYQTPSFYSYTGSAN